MARGCDPESELLLKASQGERFHDRTRKAQLISLGKMNNDVINDVVTYALPPRNMVTWSSLPVLDRFGTQTMVYNQGPLPSAEPSTGFQDFDLNLMSLTLRTLAKLRITAEVQPKYHGQWLYRHQTISAL